MKPQSHDFFLSKWYFIWSSRQSNKKGIHYTTLFHFLQSLSTFAATNTFTLNAGAHRSAEAGNWIWVQPLVKRPRCGCKMMYLDVKNVDNRHFLVEIVGLPDISVAEGASRQSCVVRLTSNIFTMPLNYLDVLLKQMVLFGTGYTHSIHI